MSLEHGVSVRRRALSLSSRGGSLAVTLEEPLSVILEPEEPSRVIQ